MVKLPIKIPTDTEKAKAKKIEENKKKLEEENKEKVKKLIPQARKWIAEFLGRNSIISGRNLGKGFNGREIIEGLKITDPIKQDAIALALVEIRKNPKNPEKVGVNEDYKIPYFYIPKNK